MSGGYSVTPEVLNTYASGLDDRANRVTAAADKVQSVNGADINAFGVLVGQALGVPTRIALAVLHDQIKSAAKAMTDQAANVRTAAQKYSATEADHAAVFAK
ncbi:type VII secretion target [Amycolatopsis australiensis]|uniref:Excreted virulence factor EspC, type VII ESX diderm n=1 Tax=Amycolatopsis australiensis TaxID=546364 RepID=A0A1K1R302_9PSEU|nr:type VII secretion target [Amycolatopsis australiensis]SFW66594.1 Excreted virulence factor EspC, type VII ESX diderm [Amycolatopsis australiensis]